MILRLVLYLASGPQRCATGPEPIVLGSGEGSDLRVEHPSISRSHARLFMQDDRLVVEDLGSSNGTYLDGRRLTGAATATPGNRLGFGSVFAEIELVSEGDATPAFQLPEPISESGEHATVHGETAPGATVHGGTAPGATAPGATARGATVASSLLERFVLQDLPQVLTAVEEELDPQVTAERLGAALWAGLPATSVEIFDRAKPTAAPCFIAGEIMTEGDPSLMAQEADDAILLRVVFESPGAARSFGGLVRLGLQLLSLSRRRAKPTGRRADFHRPPPFPDPPSLTLRMREIYERASRIAGGGVNVLILGESGTGKEVLSRYIHQAGAREGSPFVALNCAALPRDLLEAELFGIEKGVATGVEARIGKFEAAHGGTLFLDEVGDMALETQAKILRVLQERTVYRLGGKTAHPVDMQVVSATNRDLEKMIEDGKFRADLFYRLAGWEIRLPSLRRRHADIPNLAIHFFKQEARRIGLKRVGISNAAMEALKRYAWPGNIRELHHEIARGALLLSEGDLLESGHLRRVVRETVEERRPTLEAALEAAERRRILEAIEESDGSLEHVANILGISRSTLYRRMRALGIERDTD